MLLLHILKITHGQAAQCISTSARLASHTEISVTEILTLRAQISEA